VWPDARERAEETARTLVRKLMATFGSRKGESYRGAVLLSPAVIGQLILRIIQYQVHGRQLMDGKSRWEDAIGEAVASEHFTLRDEPFDLTLRGATPYDAEGVTVRPWGIIADGVLETHIDSTYTAKRRGTKTTGHAGGLHGITVPAGNHTREELLAMSDRLVVVERFSGNVDPISGDFSGVAKGSHFYENGEYRHPLSETMIAGNAFELLENIVALSDRAEPWCNAYRTPWILVDGVSVTAA
jgi:PmbA protein